MIAEILEFSKILEDKVNEIPHKVIQANRDSSAFQIQFHEYMKSALLGKFLRIMLKKKLSFSVLETIP